MLRLHILAGVALLAIMPATALADRPIYDMCDDDDVGKAVVGEISAWAKGVPFARVIIGDEGQNGTISKQHMTWDTRSQVWCKGRYDLTRTAKDGHHYTVTIDPIFFDVKEVDGAYEVNTTELPDSLESKFQTIGMILGGFYIDGRPYAEILVENQRRLQMRGRRAGR